MRPQAFPVGHRDSDRNKHCLSPWATCQASCANDWNMIELIVAHPCAAGQNGVDRTHPPHRKENPALASLRGGGPRENIQSR